MFYKISQWFMYAAIATPLLLTRSMFFPFISGKAIFFRVVVELALLFFLCHVLAHLRHPDFLQSLKAKLRHPIVICFSLFALAIVLTGLTGINAHQSFWSNFERGDGAFQILHYALFFILAVCLFTDQKSRDRLLGLQILVSIPISIYGLLQLLAPKDGSWTFVIAAGERVSGTLGNPSYLAAYLLFTLAFIIYFFLKSKSMAWRTVLGILFVFEMFILLKTGTRGAFLGLFVALLLLAIINLFITKRRGIKLALATGLLAMLAVTGVFFATPHAAVWQHVPVLDRLINFTSATTDIQPRLWTWGSAVASFLERPVTGWGIENFGGPFDKYYNAKHFGIESFFDRTHNIFLEYAAAGGLIVLLPWLAMFFFYYRSLRGRPKNFWYSVMLVVPIAYLVQGFFLFDTLPIYITLLLFMMFTVNTEPREIHLAHASHARLSGANVATALLLFVATGGLIYYTSIIPIRKNLMLVNTLGMQNQFTQMINMGKQPTVSPEQIIESFKKTLAFPSPVGQEETVGMYQKFVLSIVESIAGNQAATRDPQARAQIRTIVMQANELYDRNAQHYVGLKEQYLNAGINVRAGFSFNQPDLLARGKKALLDALAIAPTRIEFMRVVIEVSKVDGDTLTLKTWSARAHQLRPDLFPAVTES